MQASNRCILFRDGSGMWCAAPPGFRDLVLDPSGWGYTPEDALAALAEHPEFQERASAEGWPQPTTANCIEVPQLAGAEIATISFNPDISNFWAALRRQSFRVFSGNS